MFHTKNEPSFLSIDFSYNLITERTSFLILTKSKCNKNLLFITLKCRKRVTAVDLNKQCSLLAVGNTIGEAFVVNSKSGGIIYRLPGATDEVSSIKFMAGCKFN